jgi:flagella basal body P-ring formation protein FlgA
MRHASLLRVVVVAMAMFLSLVAGEVTAVLRPVVSVASERATLGEVAELSGDAALIAVIRDLPVVELPDLRERELEAGETRRAIGHGLGSLLIVSGTSRVTRRGRTIAEADIVQAARATIVADGDEMVITTLRSSGALVVPDGGSEVTMVAQPLDQSRTGDIPFKVRLMRGEVEVARALVTLRVVRHRQMVVASRILRRGERIGDGDVRSERLAVSRVGAASLTAHEIIGHEARMDLAEGTPLTAAVIILPPNVRAGQGIVLRVNTERFQLTAKGEALNDGHIGETISVRRETDGRTVRGKVIADGQVLLDH